jgi:hypothetical protein
MRGVGREQPGGTNSNTQLSRKLQDSKIKSSMAPELNLEDQKLEIGDRKIEDLILGPSLEFEFWNLKFDS